MYTALFSSQLYYRGRAVYLEFIYIAGTLLKEFKTKMASDAAGFQARLANLRDRVENFAETFPMPGYDDW